jgi:hypothetical protein
MTRIRIAVKSSLAVTESRQRPLDTGRRDGFGFITDILPVLREVFMRRP